MPRIPTADADGKFVATPMDTGLRFAGTVELAALIRPIGAAPGSARPRPADVAGARCRPPGERLDVDGPSPEPALFASGARTVAGHPGCNLRLWPWACRHDLGANDPQSRRRSVAGRRPSIDIAPFAPGRFAWSPRGDHDEVGPLRSGRPSLWTKRFRFHAGDKARPMSSSGLSRRITGCAGLADVGMNHIMHRAVQRMVPHHLIPP